MSAEKLITEHLDLWTSAVTYKNGKGKGNNGGLELTGIDKLRELILELAVRGKLMPQDPQDEPASELLERIEEEKARLYKEGKIKKPKKVPEVEEDEKPFESPKGWVWTRLEEIAQISPKNQADDSLEAGFVPMPLIGTGHKGEHDSETRRWGEVKKGYTHFSDGDIALAKITPCFENSKAAVFEQLPNGFGAGTTELHVARPYSGSINPYFILFNLKSPRYLQAGEAKMTGSAGQKRVPKEYFKNSPIALPPVNEQARIVEKVDELMALCDRLEQQTRDQLSAHETLVGALLDTLTRSRDAAELAENWSLVAEHFDTLFTTEHSIDRLEETILQLAVMGYLVSQDPDDEPAPILLDRTLENKARYEKEGSAKNIKAFTNISDNEKMFFIPNNWTWARIGHFGLVKGGKRLPKGHDLLDTPTKYKYLRVSDMKDGGISRADIKYISEETHNAIRKYTISSDDLYITIAGTIGAVGEIPFDMNGANLTENAAKIVFNGLDKTFLKYALSSEHLQQQFREKVNQMAQPKLALHRIESSVLALPPLSEQKRIVAKIDELKAFCRRLRSHLDEAESIQNNLADSIVKEAVA